MMDLNYAGGDNPAGIYLIRCVPVVGVKSLPTPATGGPMEVAGPPVFHPGYAWLQLYGTEGTKTYAEEEEETDNGPIWSVSVGLFLPNDSSLVRSNLSQMARHRYILECQDNSGQWRRLGTQVESLQLKYKFSIGAQVSDRRGATLTFSGTLTQIPPMVTGI